MVAIAAGPEIKIEIGGQDWSRCFDGLEVGTPERDDSGLLLTTGRLSLAPTMPPFAPPQSMNPRANRTFWKRGQTVRIWARIGGQWQAHPHGWLYLIQPPPTPGIGSNLELEVGCLLALKNFDQPGEEDGLAIGVSTPRHQVINALLAKAGCPALADTIPGWPLTFPLSRQGSFVSQAGKVAYAGQRALYQDNAGQIRAKPLTWDLTAAPVHVMRIGLSEILYEGNGNPESPVEIYRTSGVAQNLKSNYETRSSYSEDYDEASNINPAFTGQALIRATTSRTTTNANGQTTLVDVYEAGALVYPITDPDALALTWRSSSESRQYFSGNRLVAEETVTQQPLEAIAAGWIEGIPEAQRNIGRQTATTTDRREFVYDGAERLQVNRTIETKPTAAIVGNQGVWAASLAFNPFTAALNVTRWVKTSLGYEIQESQSTAKVLVVQGESSSTTTLSLRTDSTTVSAARGELNQPPATQYRPAPYTVEEQQVDAEARFNIESGDDRDRPPQIVDYVVSQDQLEAIASNEGAVLIGRAQGQIVQIPYRHIEPLQTMEAIELDGTRVLFQVDGVRYTHSATEAVVGFNGIWLATTPAGSSTPAPPFNPVLPASGGMRSGGLAGFWPYAVTPIAFAAVRGGSRSGGVVPQPPFTAFTVGSSPLTVGSSTLGLGG